MLYFDKIDESANIRTIGSGKKYQMPLNELLDSLNNYPGGWLTWHTHNQYKLDTDIPIYCTHYFEKYAGYGIDTLGVEIYRYTEKMLKDTTLFKTDKHLPAANINLEDDFSITFGLNYQADTKSVPFIFSVEDKEVYQILVNKSEISLSYLPGTKTNINSQLDSDNQLNHIVIYQKGNKAGIILNGTKVSEKRIRKKVNDVVKFTINKTFRGNIDDIRIYDFAVNESQAQMIINNYNIPGTDKLTVNGESFRTLFHWQKR